jgi:hypothetical protein
MFFLSSDCLSSVICVPVINVLHDLFNRFSFVISLENRAVKDQVQSLGFVPHFGILVLEVDDSVLRDCQIDVVVSIDLFSQKSLLNHFCQHTERVKWKVESFALLMIHISSINYR